MNDSNGIRFNTTNVRGFSEYMYHLLTSKYEERATDARAKLNGGNTGSDGRAHSADGGGSMGSSGVEYYGLDIGKSEVENARAGAEALEQIMEAWRSMANGGAYAAEKYSGQDTENADELGKDFRPGEKT